MSSIEAPRIRDEGCRYWKPQVTVCVNWAHASAGWVRERRVVRGRSQRERQDDRPEWVSTFSLGDEKGKVEMTVPPRKISEVAVVICSACTSVVKVSGDIVVDRGRVLAQQRRRA